ncbi:hypothetical protein BC830DRAFT_1168571 [Chytriomyces sp. MP71]|nr:hypothetical protein BC830DRAFT_1168571 [Chytriomyces sp. MP71]
MLFLATGIISTLGAQWLKYRGAANSLSFVTSLMQFAGMVLVAALPPPETSREMKPIEASAYSGGWIITTIINHLNRFGPANVQGAALISIFEVGGNLILVAGMFLVGSGVYMVIYSSIVVFTALFSRILLPGRKLSGLQWLAVFAICFGLSLTALGTKSGHSSEIQDKPVLFGVLVCIFGTAVLSLVYVATDHILAGGTSTPYSQSIYVGLFSTFFTLVVMLVVSIPTLLTLPLLDWDVILAHIILLLSSLGHSVAYFELVESTGGVATGVLQGLRAVGVFGLSHSWFCGIDENQCFNAWKGAATVIVVAGVVLFAAAKGWASGGNDAIGVGRTRKQSGPASLLGTQFQLDGDEDSILMEDVGRQ